MADLLMDTDIVAVEREEDECDQFLPYDLMLEIFSYLPAKTILQLQLLSRPFRRLAADRRFRLLQSQRNLASGVFIVAPSQRQLDFFLLDHAAGFPPLLVESIMSVRNVALLASSRGLLFYSYDHGASFFVVNPTCNEATMLPGPPKQRCPLLLDEGLAVKFLDDDDHLKCNYQLVYLQRTDVWSSLYQICLYDSAAEDWIVDDLQVNLGSASRNLNNLVVFEGSVFVASSFTTSSSSSRHVAAIDTSTMLVSFLPAPDSFSLVDEVNVAVWEEAGERPWLCLVHYHFSSHKFTLWRWSKGSMWVKFSEVVVHHNKRIYYFNLGDGGAMNGMLLFLDCHDQSYAYSFKWQQFIELGTKTREYPRRYITYTNTLRPC